VRVGAINEPGERLVLEIEFLQLQINQRAEMTQPHVVDDELIELVAVDRQMLAAGVLPGEFLVHIHADEVRHDLGETSIVIALDPHDLHTTLRVREFADEAEELPVFFFQAAKVEVGKNIAQQDEAPKTLLAQHLDSVARPADFRAEVDIGEDERVDQHRLLHLFCSKPVLQEDER